MSNKELVLSIFDQHGIDMRVVIQEMFMGYKQRKQRKQLYSEDNTIPTTLIKMYYSLNPDQTSFESLKKAFVSRYIKEESKLEEVHEADEVKGLRVMYEYIHSDEINFMLNVYTLKELHEKLYSKTAHPEFGGEFRKYDVYLPGTGTEITEWSMIRYELNKIDEDIQDLVELAPLIRNGGDANWLLEYLDACVVLGCRLIKVHPFADGNGRTVRGFVNKLLEDAGLPPVYIKAQERTEYHKAMNKANNEGDYTDIKNFYRYKVCDSIVELDINQRLKNETYAYGSSQVFGEVKLGNAIVKEKKDDLKRLKSDD